MTDEPAEPADGRRLAGPALRGAPFPTPGLVRGAEEVARQALLFSRVAKLARPALVNGAAGLVTIVDGRVASVMSVTVRGGLVTEIDIVADPERVRRIELSVH